MLIAFHHPAGSRWVSAEILLLMCSARDVDVTDPGTQPLDGGQGAGIPPCNCPLGPGEAGTEHGTQQPFPSGPGARRGLEGPAAGRHPANFPASLWLRLPPSTGLQLALVAHQLQTLNWHMHCADGAVTSAGLELIKSWNI